MTAANLGHGGLENENKADARLFCSGKREMERVETQLWLNTLAERNARRHGDYSSHLGGRGTHCTGIHVFLLFSVGRRR